MADEYADIIIKARAQTQLERDRVVQLEKTMEETMQPQLHLLKESGETHIDDKFSLNVLSVFDRENWIKPTNSDKINIAKQLL